MRALIRATTAAGAAVVVLCACSSAVRAGGSAARPAAHSTRALSGTRALGGGVTSPQVSAQPGSQPAKGSQPDRPTPARKPKNFCAHNSDVQKVIVRIDKQHAWMCAHHHDVFDTPVTTGMVGQWTHTPTGHYMIQGRNTSTVLTLNTGATYDVKYWIPFEAPLFGFHDASWQRFPFGSPKYKTAGSHGCVHMPLKAMKFLYNWSARPTAVHIT